MLLELLQMCGEKQARVAETRVAFFIEICLLAELFKTTHHTLMHKVYPKLLTVFIISTDL